MPTIKERTFLRSIIKELLATNSQASAAYGQASTAIYGVGNVT